MAICIISYTLCHQRVGGHMMSMRKVSTCIFVETAIHIIEDNYLTMMVARILDDVQKY